MGPQGEEEVIPSRQRWCGVASWARRQLRAKGERCAGAKGQGEDNRGRNKQGEGKTEKEVKLKQRTGGLGKRDSGGNRDIDPYLQRKRGLNRGRQSEVTGIEGTTGREKDCPGLETRDTGRDCPGCCC